jgi:hypothetical protein
VLGVLNKERILEAKREKAKLLTKANLSEQ